MVGLHRLQKQTAVSCSPGKEAEMSRRPMSMLQRNKELNKLVNQTLVVTVGAAAFLFYMDYDARKRKALKAQEVERRAPHLRGFGGGMP